MNNKATTVLNERNKNGSSKKGMSDENKRNPHGSFQFAWISRLCIFFVVVAIVVTYHCHQLILLCIVRVNILNCRNSTDLGVCSKHTQMQAQILQRRGNRKNIGRWRLGLDTCCCCNLTQHYLPKSVNIDIHTIEAHTFRVDVGEEEKVTIETTATMTTTHTISNYNNTRKYDKAL